MVSSRTTFSSEVGSAVVEAVPVPVPARPLPFPFPFATRKLLGVAVVSLASLSAGETGRGGGAEERKSSEEREEEGE